jgi:hypothetical protein
MELQITPPPATHQAILPGGTDVTLAGAVWEEHTTTSILVLGRSNIDEVVRDQQVELDLYGTQLYAGTQLYPTIGGYLYAPMTNGA